MAALVDEALPAGLPAGLARDVAALRRFDLLLRAAVAGIAAVEDEAAAQGLALRAEPVFDAGAPVLVLHFADWVAP